MVSLVLENFCVSVNGNEILSKIDLKVNPGEMHLIMGRNGSGKSTLMSAIAGKPGLITKGTILLDGKDAMEMKPHQRALAGVFMAFQNPVEVPGVELSSFLKQAYNTRSEKRASIQEFEKILHEKMQLLGMDERFSSRELNLDFSGGEKKKSELLQMLILSPTLVLLDEIDSGLDVDALSFVSLALSEMKKQKAGMILVSHHGQLVKKVRPDFVHVLMKKQIVLSGGAEIAQKIADEGYGWIEDKL